MAFATHELAYAAALIDGEGSVTLKPGIPWRRPRVVMTSTTRELCDYMLRFGGTMHKDARRRSERHKITFQWQIQGAAAISLLEDIVPYMREPAKVARARMILLDWRRLFDGGSSQGRAEFEQRFFGT